MKLEEPQTPSHPTLAILTYILESLIKPAIISS